EAARLIAEAGAPVEAQGQREPAEPEQHPGPDAELEWIGPRVLQVEPGDQEEEGKPDRADVNRPARSDLRADQDQRERDQQEQEVPRVAGPDGIDARRGQGSEEFRKRGDPETAGQDRSDTRPCEQLRGLPEAEVPRWGRRARGDLLSARVIAP